MDSATESDDDFSGQSHKRHRLDITASMKEEWSDDKGENVGAAIYKKYRAKRSVRRKKSIPFSRRAGDNEAANTQDRLTSTGVGKRPRKTKVKKSKSQEVISSDEDLMEWTVPEYLQKRREKFTTRFEKLKEGGLRLAPTYGDVEFSEEEGDGLKYVQERPDFPKGKTMTSYRDIELPYSAGIVPAPVAQYLRDYQVKGAAFLHELFVYQKGGILGDDMGLGKTIQVIAFLTAAYGKTGDARDQKRMRKMRRTGKWYPKTLIICPGSLMSNWRDELERWGWWHTEIYHGLGKEKEAVVASAKSGMLEIMITTYSTYRLNKSEINLVEWDCVVADECHVIKERASEITKTMNEVNALCRIGLTGTAIQNKYEELWTLLNWANPGVVGPVSTWKANVAVPLKLGQSHDATMEELRTARTTANQLVNNLLPRFFLRRMKILIKDQLPKKTDRVISCPLTTTQADAYENFLDCEIVQLIKNAHEPCRCGKGKKAGWCCDMLLENGSRWQSWVFPAMVTLQKLSNHLALLIPQGNDTQERQAKDLEYLMITMPDKWKDFYATRDNIIHQSNAEYCGKWRILRKLLRFWYEEGDNKVLIFSHSVRLLQMLQRLFDSTESRYNVAYLDGSMKYEDRYVAVQNFNADPMQFVFLISTKAGGVGLNITSANKVVIVDPNWNPSYDLQAQDRAYRIGQTRDVEVYRLVSQGTIEEVVYARQIYKQQQANIGYTGSHERRYFQGVQDRKDQKGEIFGLRNLFAYENENVRLRDIVHKTNVAEFKAGVRFHKIEVEEQGTAPDSTSEDEQSSSQIKLENAAMSQLAAEIKGEDADLPRAGKAGKSSKSASFLSDLSDRNDAKRHDPVQAILAAAGVSYTHENSEVIGTSRVEAQLSKAAEEANLDVSERRKKAFGEESQTHSSSRLHQNAVDHQPVTNDDGSTTPNPSIRFKYRPPLDVKQRHFCSMAAWAGYGSDLDSVINFAMFVESCTQANRREILDRFYRWRRDQLDGDSSLKTMVKTAANSSTDDNDDNNTNDEKGHASETTIHPDSSPHLQDKAGVTATTYSTSDIITTTKQEIRSDDNNKDDDLHSPETEISSINKAVQSSTIHGGNDHSYHHHHHNHNHHDDEGDEDEDEDDDDDDDDDDEL